jgi:ParB family chromosome partitioning protein
MYVDLATVGTGSEEELALEFEEPAFATLGFAYEQRGRLSGGVYHPVLRKVDGWIKGPLAKALPQRQERAALLLELDEAVTTVVDALKKKGMQSPYLRNFVVARINPLRFIKGDPPPLSELLPTMTKRARGMNVDKINSADIARSGGAPESGE